MNPHLQRCEQLAVRAATSRRRLHASCEVVADHARAVPAWLLLGSAFAGGLLVARFAAPRVQRAAQRERGGLTLLAGAITGEVVAHATRVLRSRIDAALGARRRAAETANEH